MEEKEEKEIVKGMRKVNGGGEKKETRRKTRKGLFNYIQRQH